jgi:hypothetical protein
VPALLCAGIAADTLASLSANPREALTVQSSSLRKPTGHASLTTSNWRAYWRKRSGCQTSTTFGTKREATVSPARTGA